jgi:hypothetical protein
MTTTCCVYHKVVNSLANGVPPPQIIREILSGQSPIVKNVNEILFKAETSYIDDHRTYSTKKRSTKGLLFVISFRKRGVPQQQQQQQQQQKDSYEEVIDPSICGEMENFWVTNAYINTSCQCKNPLYVNKDDNEVHWTTRSRGQNIDNLDWDVLKATGVLVQTHEYMFGSEYNIYVKKEDWVNFKAWSQETHSLFNESVRTPIFRLLQIQTLRQNTLHNLVIGEVVNYIGKSSYENANTTNIGASLQPSSVIESQTSASNTSSTKRKVQEDDNVTKKQK